MKNIITLSKSAFQQFRRIHRETASKAIVFGLKGGGCNGFEYQLTPTNKELRPGDDLQIIRKDDRNRNVHPSDEDVVVHICGKSIMHIVWKKDIMGESFKFDNPSAKASCGCGTSFSPY